MVHCQKFLYKKFYFLDAQGKQKYQPPNRSWMARHENRRRKSVDEEEDYDFKTKRQIVNEFEFAPETAENLDTLEGQSQSFNFEKITTKIYHNFNL